MIKLELTKEEAEVLDNYIFRKLCKLEDSGLTDSKCYIELTKIRHKIKESSLQ